MTKTQQIKRTKRLLCEGYGLRKTVEQLPIGSSGETLFRDDDGSLLNTGKDSGTIVDASFIRRWADAVAKEIRRGTSFRNLEEAANGFDDGISKKHALEQMDLILTSFDAAIDRFRKLPCWKRLLSYTFLHRYLNP